MKAFLSYPSEHLEDAREVKQFVTAAGVECWFDKDSLEMGDDWERDRRLAQSGADVVILLCARQTTDRNGVYQREISQALASAKDRRLGSTYILPLRLEEVELPPELSCYQYVDKFDSGWKRRMAGGLLKAYKDLSETPPAALQVAGARPDEGGIIMRTIDEVRPEGEINASWPQYALDGEYWEFVNSIIASRVLGGVYTTRREFTEWGREGSYWEFHIRQSYRKRDLVSLTIGSSSYFTGAAHPNHSLEAINILGPEVGIVSASELFDRSPDVLKYVAEYVEFDLRRQFPVSEAPNLSHYVESLGWDLFEHFTFNEAGMEFAMSPSAGLPHVLGVLGVYMPWEHVGQFLTPAAKGVLLPEST